jgi:ABC-2 type transport system ATP-binding protein
MIELRGAVKIFDGKAAVDGVDLDVRPGSVYGLIGPNGAGKTTALRMMATLILPDAGSIRVAGRDLPDGVAEARRTIGYMGDRPGSFRGFSSEEYLAYFGRLHGLRREVLRKRIETVLDLTDLGPVRDERVSVLSTGMRQRLALAKTLIHDPEILILDEPASGLDPRARIEIRELLKELGRMGKTVVISSHILADLEDICSDIGILEKGRLVTAGSLEEIRRSCRVGRRAFRVRVPGGSAAIALEAVRAAPGVAAAEAVPAAVDAEIRAEMEDDGGNPILAALIEKGIEILAFSEERASLESIFIDRTRGDLQ